MRHEIHLILDHFNCDDPMQFNLVHASLYGRPWGILPGVRVGVREDMQAIVRGTIALRYSGEYVK